MSKKNTYKPKIEKIQEAQEPVSPYQGMEITFCNSFEEMNEVDAREMARLSPLQHLKNATTLIEAVYADALKIKQREFIIHFENHE